MCLITYLPEGVEMDFDKCRRAFHVNNDGWGIMALDKASGEILTYKSLGQDFEEFKNVYNNYVGMEKGVHFRTKTHGTISIENCHPFQVTEGVYMMHNGCISNMPWSRERSDSNLFSEAISAAVDRGFLEVPEYLDLMSRVISGGNKLLFLNKDKFVFVNKDVGKEEQDGTWYSNQSYFWGGSVGYAGMYDYEDYDSLAAYGYGSTVHHIPNQREGYYNPHEGTTSRKYLDPIYLSDGYKLILESL